MIKKPSIEKFTGGFGNAHIVVVGDVMLDSYLKGTTERISPEAPVPVVLETSLDHVLGGAGNVARNIASLGGKVTLVGVVGRDAEAAIVRKLCASSKITERLVLDPSRPTTVKLRITSRRSQLLRVDKESTHPVSRSIERALLAHINTIPAPDLVVISDYIKGCLNERIVEALANRFGKNKIIADVKPQHAGLCKGLSVITPNLSEAAAIAGELADSSSAHADRLAKALSRTFSTSVVLTRGEHGMTIYDKRIKKVRHIASRAVAIHDVTGAGDTVVAALALMIAGGADLYTAADFANHAAGFVVSKEGTTAITAKEIPIILERHARNHKPHKVLL